MLDVRVAPNFDAAGHLLHDGDGALADEREGAPGGSARRGMRRSARRGRRFSTEGHRRDKGPRAAAKARATVQSQVMRFVAASGLLLLVLGVCSAAAQERIVVQGVVQWVAGTRLVMVADTGVSLRIDLMRADQRSYTGLQAGDRIVVVGTVAPERDRLLAESITSGAGTIPMDSWRMFPQSP
jgi:hypothetical protein